MAAVIALAISVVLSLLSLGNSGLNIIGHRLSAFSASICSGRTQASSRNFRSKSLSLSKNHGEGGFGCPLLFKQVRLVNGLASHLLALIFISIQGVHSTTIESSTNTRVE